MNANAQASYEKILQAAIGIFAREGFYHASTNEIVKQAGVSKGMLFHHFTNKEKLYNACLVYVVENYHRFLKERLHFADDDFFERLLYAASIKADFARNFPQELALINRALYMEQKGVTRQDIQDLVAKVLYPLAHEFYSGADTSKFRDNMPVEKVMQYIQLAVEARWMQYSNASADPALLLQNVERLINETEEIVALVRDGAYK